MTDKEVAPTAAPEDRPALKTSAWPRIGIVLCVFALIGIALSLVNLTPDLSHLDVTLLSGSEHGHYHLVVVDAEVVYPGFGHFERTAHESGHRHARHLESVEGFEDPRQNCLWALVQHRLHDALVEDVMVVFVGGDVHR